MKAFHHVSNPTLIEESIYGTFRARFALELFNNTLFFPITNILYELLIGHPLDYLRSSDPYIIIVAALIQAYWLTCHAEKRLHRLLGHLIGPTIYTFIEASLEGAQFFTAPNHVAYWFFSIAIGIAQELRLYLPRFSALFTIIENATRVSIIFFMYGIFETHLNHNQTPSLASFFADPSHVFVGMTIVIIGLSIGLANATADTYLKKLRYTSQMLKTYSEWLLGRDLLARSLSDPTALQTIRRERTILFMDIRGFTAWSEVHTPEEVVELLNEYYRRSESILLQHSAIKWKFTADEVMAIFPHVQAAITAANGMIDEIHRFLAAKQLGVGIGIDVGPVVEGVLGGANVRFYDAMGDTVNAAKRIENHAQAGEILISERAQQYLTASIPATNRRELHAKGKSQAIITYLLNA